MQGKVRFCLSAPVERGQPLATVCTPVCAARRPSFAPARRHQKGEDYFPIHVERSKVRAWRGIPALFALGLLLVSSSSRWASWADDPPQRRFANRGDREPTIIFKPGPRSVLASRHAHFRASYANDSARSAIGDSHTASSTRHLDADLLGLQLSLPLQPAPRLFRGRP